MNKKRNLKAHTDELGKVGISLVLRMTGKIIQML